MRPQAFQRDDTEAEINPHDPEDQKRVQEFANMFYPKLLKRDIGGSRNTIKYFGCCHAFISRYKVNHNHDEDTCMTFAVFIHRNHVKDEKSFEKALIGLLKRDYDQGKQVFCPSYNTAHRAILEEEEVENEVEVCKRLITEKDIIIATLQEQLSKKNQVIDGLKEERIELVGKLLTFMLGSIDLVDEGAVPDPKISHLIGSANLKPQNSNPN